jgi:predicted ATPase/DNA-binding SARP family transcriptional activator
MQFAILGPLEVTDEGARVPLGGQRQRAVLARLLVDAGRVVSVDRLIDDVWNSRPPATAHKTLQKYVSELRKALGQDVLRTESAGYLISIDREALDAARFERLIDEGRFDAALALWRGDLLADLSELTFVAAEHARLESLRLAAVEGRFAALLDAGRHAEAVGDLADAASAHPLRERFTALHMLALYRSGRQVEALRVFDAHRRRLASDIGVEPGVELRALEAAILRQDAALDLQAAAPLSGNLPTALTSFVGRESDLAAIAQEVSENRFVTLTGPGGVGKTRLAVQLGSEIGDRYPGGVWLVDLAPVRNGDMVPDAVATALGIDVRPAPDVYVALVSAHARRPPCILVLDNCEHLVDAVRELVTRILQMCGNASVLATSRRPIGVEGEYVRPVSPLSHEEAVSLFVQRARLAGARDLSGEAVDEICTRLDRLPLAIELAASQLRVLGLVEISARLQDQLQFRGRGSDASPRQRTLNDMVAWSHDLLPADTQRAFARLGVFASTFTLEAAEAVCGSGALGHITTLVDHSLLARVPTSTSSLSRYRMLETLRLFALDRLVASGPGELDAARRTHADFYRRMAVRAGEHLWGADEQMWRLDLEAEEPNIHAALGWAEDNDPEFALRFAVALWPYWDLRWGERKGVAYVRGVLDRPDLDVDDALRAWALTVSADLSANPGDARQSIPWATEAIAIFRELGDDLGLRHALLALGSGLGNQGRLDEADAALAEAIELGREHGDKIVIARALNHVSFIASRRGNFALAADLNREEISRWAELGSKRGEATGMRHLAVALLTLGDLDEAERLCHRALEIWTELDDPTSIAHVRATLGDIARKRGDFDSASELYSAAMEGFDAVGDRRCTASTFKNFGVIAARRNEHAESHDLFRRGLALRYELGDEAGLAECLEGLAGSYLASGRASDAALLLGAADSLRETTGAPIALDERARVEALIDASRALLGDAFAEAWETGRRHRSADIVEFIENDVDSRTPVR